MSAKNLDTHNRWRNKTVAFRVSPEENKQITLDILNGKEQGHKRNAVLLNAGAVLYIAKKADTFAGGVKLAGEIIDSGAAMKKLEQFVKLTN